MLRKILSWTSCTGLLSLISLLGIGMVLGFWLLVFIGLAGGGVASMF